MEATTMRSLAEHIAEQRRRDREYYRTGQHSASNPKEEPKSHWGKRSSSGDDGFDTNGTGQSGHNL